MSQFCEEFVSYLDEACTAHHAVNLLKSSTQVNLLYKSEFDFLG